RPRFQAADEEDRARIALAFDVREIRVVDAVVDDVDRLDAVQTACERRIFAADGDDARRLLEDAPLEALELAPLAADIPALEGIRLRLMMPLPKQGDDVVGHDDLATRRVRRQGIGV